MYSVPLSIFAGDMDIRAGFGGIIIPKSYDGLSYNRGNWGSSKQPCKKVHVVYHPAPCRGRRGWEPAGHRAD